MGDDDLTLDEEHLNEGAPDASNKLDFDSLFSLPNKGKSEKTPPEHVVEKRSHQSKPGSSSKQGDNLIGEQADEATSPTDRPSSNEATAKDPADHAPSGPTQYQIVYDSSKNAFTIQVLGDGLVYNKDEMLKACRNALNALKKQGAKSSVYGSFIQFVTTAFGLPTDFFRGEDGAEDALELAETTNLDTDFNQ
jgi:hypothetical protein